jgi:hypothetical protein
MKLYLSSYNLGGEPTKLRELATENLKVVIVSKYAPFKALRDGEVIISDTESEL